VIGDIVLYSGYPINSPSNGRPVIASVPPVNVIGPLGFLGNVKFPSAFVVVEPTLLVTVAPEIGPSIPCPENPPSPAHCSTFVLHLRHIKLILSLFLFA
jgi:hypothetical protein